MVVFSGWNSGWSEPCPRRNPSATNVGVVDFRLPTPRLPRPIIMIRFSQRHDVGGEIDRHGLGDQDNCFDVCGNQRISRRWIDEFVVVVAIMTNRRRRRRRSVAVRRLAISSTRPAYLGGLRSSWRTVEDK